MKSRASIQDTKLHFLEVFMKVNDKVIIEKLYKVLIEESQKSKNASVITDELMEELDRRWKSYKDKSEEVYTFDSVVSEAEHKIKRLRKK